MNNFCGICMKKHPDKIITQKEEEIYKGVLVEFTATYKSCSGELLETEDMFRSNMNAMREAYYNYKGDGANE